MTESNDQTTPEGDETASFIVALISGLLGFLSLVTYAAMKGISYFAEGETMPLLDQRWWFLVGGVGLTVLAIGLQAHRFNEFITQRRSLVALNVALMTILAFVLTVLANYVGARHYKEFDWTHSGVYSISDESIQVVSHLEKPIRCWIIWPSNDESAEVVRRLLDHYRAKSDKLTVEHADPSADLSNFELIVKKLGLEDRSFEDMAGVVVQSGYYDDKGDWKVDKSKHVSHRELFEQSFDPMHGGQGGQKKFKGEQVITNAIIEVTEQQKPKLYFLTGHQEAELEGQTANNPNEMGFLSKVLRQKNYDLATLDILKRERKDIPDDASVVVIAFPKVKLDDGELAALEDYLKKGGKLLALMAPNIQPNAAGNAMVWVPTGLEPLLKRYNVGLEDKGLVSFERIPGLGIAPSQKCYVTWFDSESKITQPLASTGARVLFYGARPLKALTENPHAKATEIAKTFEGCYAVPDPATFMDNPTMSDNDKPQAWPVLVAVEQKIDAPAPAPDAKDKDKDKQPKEKVTRLVVAGDSRWVSNPVVDAGGYRNEPLFFNCISYLVGQERFTKEPAKESTYKLDMNGAQIMLYSALSLLGLPLFAIMLGLSVWLIRRR